MGPCRTAESRSRSVPEGGLGPEGNVSLRLLVLWGSSILFAAMREKTKLVCLAVRAQSGNVAIERHQRNEQASDTLLKRSWPSGGAKVRRFVAENRRSRRRPVADDLLDRFDSALGVRPLVLFGMTDHGIPTLPSPARKAGSSGRLRPGVEARIVDPDGRDLPPGEVGELLLASPGTAAGYYKDPDATARTFRNGWLHTGDLARLDRDRDLYIVGRIKELIIQGGVNVHPSDVVDVISQLGGVRECAVVGTPNSFLGEEVTAGVVAAAGASLSEEVVLEHCRRNMDLRKAPTNVRFLPALPRTSSGKVRLADLRTQIISDRAEIVKTELVCELEVMEPHRRREEMRALILACVHHRSGRRGRAARGAAREATPSERWGSSRSVP